MLYAAFYMVYMYGDITYTYKFMLHVTFKNSNLIISHYQFLGTILLRNEVAY